MSEYEKSIKENPSYVLLNNKYCRRNRNVQSNSVGGRMLKGFVKQTSEPD
jgi:hypothetical protein